MSYTGKDVQREANEYNAWAKEQDRKQFLAYMEWLRNNREYIKRGKKDE